jgi:dimeric dUTPase (all-alpha-NTP-PPase superfamily)
MVPDKFTKEDYSSCMSFINSLPFYVDCQTSNIFMLMLKSWPIEVPLSKFDLASFIEASHKKSYVDVTFENWKASSPQRKNVNTTDKPF